MRTTDINKIKIGFYTYEEWDNLNVIYICKYIKGACIIYYQKDEEDEEYLFDNPNIQDTYSLTDLKIQIKESKIYPNIKVIGYSTKEELIADHPEIFFR